MVVEACDNGAGKDRKCTSSPTVHITVFDGVGNDGAVAPSSSNGDGSQFILNKLSKEQRQFNRQLDESSQTNRRNEAVVVGLVIVFSILFLTTILVIVCFVYRRGPCHWFIGRTSHEAAAVKASTYSKTVAQDVNVPNGRAMPDSWIDEGGFCTHTPHSKNVT